MCGAVGATASASPSRGVLTRTRSPKASTSWRPQAELERAEARRVRLARGLGQPNRRRQPDDAGHVFGAAAPPPLLRAAAHERVERRASPDVERADPLRPVDLVAAERHQVHAERVPHREGRSPAAWTASVWNPGHRRHVRWPPSSATGLTVPVSLLTHISDTNPISAVRASRTVARSTGACRSGRQECDPGGRQQRGGARAGEQPRARQRT